MYGRCKPIQVAINDIEDANFINDMKKLQTGGFPVRVRKIREAHTDWNQKTIPAEYSVTAKKGHVSIRGGNGVRWYVKNTIPIYKVFVRNGNGGYEIRYSNISSIDEAINIADDILSTENTPNMPKFTPEELPEAYGFGAEIKLKIQGSYYAGGPIVEYDAKVSKAYVESIGSFDEKLFVSSNNTLDPNREAWFIICCMGHTSRTFYIISNGEKWYPLRRSTKKRHRVSMSNKIELNKIDELIINGCIKEYIKSVDN